MPSNGILSRSQPRFITEWIKLVTQQEVMFMLRGSVFPCHIWWRLSSKDTLPVLTYSYRDFRLSYMALFHHLVSELLHSPLLIPLTFLDHLTSRHMLRKLPVPSQLGSALPLLPEPEDQALQWSWNKSVNSTRGPTIIRLEKDSPHWRSSGLQLGDIPPKSVSIDLPGLD